MNLIVVVALTVLLGSCGGVSSTDKTAASKLTRDAVTTDIVVQASERMTLASAAQAPAATKELTVNHHQIECEGYQVGHCLLVKEGDGPWKFFYQKIEGFEYQWGIESKILVEANTPRSRGLITDASSGYTLISVVQSRVVKEGTRFDYVARGGHGGIVRTGEQQYSLRGDKAFYCEPDDCDTIESILSQNLSVLLRFSHASDVNQSLKLKTVLCTDTAGAFYRSCAMPDYSTPVAS